MRIPIQLVSTIIRQNEEDVKRMAFYAYCNQLPWTMTAGVKSSVRGADNEAGDVRIQERLDEQKKKEIQYLLKNRPVEIERKPCTYCKDYRIGYWITWNGEIRFCSFMNEPHIKIREQAFREAWEKLIRYEEELDWPEECKTCKAQKGCFKCAGMLNAECGSPHKVTEEFCDRVKRWLDEGKGEWRI